MPTLRGTVNHRSPEVATKATRRHPHTGRRFASKPVQPAKATLLGIPKSGISLFLLYCLLVQSHLALGGLRGDEVVETSSVVRQVTWGAIGVIALALLTSDWRAFTRHLRKLWPLLLVPACALLSLLWSEAADFTLKRALLLNIVALSALAVALHPPRPSQFMIAVLLVLGGYLLINFIAVMVSPEAAIYKDQWLGLYPQKNNAGKMAGTLGLFAFFAIWWAKYRWAKWLMVGVCGASVYFLVMTGSKTPMGFVPASIMLVMLIAGFLAVRHNRTTFYAGALAMAAIAGLMVTFIDFTVDDFIQLFTDNVTFTGRVRLWDYTILEASKNPVLGVGYGAFWHLGEPEFNRVAMYNPLFARLATAHNAALAIWSELGFVGLVLTTVTVLWQVKNIILLNDRPTSRRHRLWVYRALLGLLLFTLLHGLFETNLMTPTGSLSILFFVSASLTAAWLDKSARTTQRHRRQTREKSKHRRRNRRKP